MKLEQGIRPFFVIIGTTQYLISIIKFYLREENKNENENTLLNNNLIIISDFVIIINIFDN